MDTVILSFILYILVDGSVETDSGLSAVISVCETAEKRLIKSVTLPVYDGR